MGLAEDIDAFLQKSDVDDRAGASLRAEPESVQRAVLDRGDMSDCRNQSASLIARIRVAKEGAGGSSGRPRSRSPGKTPANCSDKGSGDRPSIEELDDFIADNKIDEMAGRQLKEADGPTQKNVLERGSLTDCRNPSAVCLARIRDAKASRAQPTIQQLGLTSSALPTTPMVYNAYGAYGNPQAMYAAQMSANPAYAAYAAAYGACGGYPAAAAYGACPAAAAYGGYAPAMYGYPGYSACGGYPMAMAVPAYGAYVQGAYIPGTMPGGGMQLGGALPPGGMPAQGAPQLACQPQGVPGAMPVASAIRYAPY